MKSHLRVSTCVAMLAAVACVGLCASASAGTPASTRAGAVHRKADGDSPLYIYTYAGDGAEGYSGDGGPAIGSALNSPWYTAFDAAGNLYIADTDNNRIRKVDAAGNITTVAGIGTPGFSGDGGLATKAAIAYPYGVAADSAGNVYIADGGNSRIRKIDAATGILTTVAGNGVGGFSGDGGAATDAEIDGVVAVALDARGNLYLADAGDYRVRRVDAATGVITTVAGDGIQGYGGDGGPATQAEISLPWGIALDGAGNLYIVDESNDRIRKVDATTGIITTVAGNGVQGYSGDGGKATSAELNEPFGIALDAAGNLYISDSSNERIRVVDVATGIIGPLVGNGTQSFGGDGGAAIDAELAMPTGLTVDSAGNLYISDTANNRIRVVHPESTIATTTTLTGPDLLSPSEYFTLTAAVTAANGSIPSGTLTFLNGSTSLGDAYVDNSGMAYLELSLPMGIDQLSAYYNGTTVYAASTSPALTVDVGDAKTSTGLQVSATSLTYGQTLTLTATVSSPSGGPMGGIVFFYNGIVSLGSSVMGMNGVATLTFSPTVGSYAITAEYVGGGAYLPSDSPDINVVVSGPASTTPNIYTYAGGGFSTTGGDGNGGPATESVLFVPTGVTLDTAGNLYITEGPHVRKVELTTGIITTFAGGGDAPAPGYGDGGPATSATLAQPEAVAFDAAGNLYIADMNICSVRKVNGATGIITTIAGNGKQGYGGDGGPATSAALNWPYGLAVDSAGNVYIGDYYNNRIRKVDAVTGIISTFAGNGTRSFSGDGGPATSAGLSYPQGMAFDGAGNLFFADFLNDRVRRVDAKTGIITTIAGTGSGGLTGDNGPATSAELAGPEDVATDTAGNIYIADSGNYRVRKVDTATGVITTVAGTGPGFSGDGGPAISAELDYVSGVTVAPNGNFYVSDTGNNRIRLVGTLPTTNPIATTTTLASSASTLTVGQTLTLTATVTAVSGATPAGTVKFLNGTALLGTGTLTASGVATLSLTLPIGSYSITADYAGASPDLASVSSPAIPVTVSIAATTTTLTASATNVTFGQTLILTAVVHDASGAVVPGALVTFFNGTTQYGAGAPDSNGVASFAQIAQVGIYSFTAHYAGDSLTEPSESSAVKVVVQYGATTSPNIYTLAGDGTFGYSGTGGLATRAELKAPREIATDAAGNLYFADIYNSVVQRVDHATGIITTVAGTGMPGFSGDGGPAASAQLYEPESVAVDAAGNLYIADYFNNRIRKVTAATGIITTIAGDSDQGYEKDGVLATTTALYWPVGVGVDAKANVYIADTYDERIRRVDAVTGIITTVAGPGEPPGIGDGGLATKANLSFPTAVLLNAAGDLYISDSLNDRIRKVDASTGIIQTVVGNGVVGYTGDYGPATDAELHFPEGAAFDQAGNLYFADQQNNVVRRVDATTGVITTVAGIGVGGFSGDGGPANRAQLASPAGVALDAAGNIYIGDTNNSRVRIVGMAPTGAVISTTTALATSASTLAVGQTLTLTAVVKAASGGAPTGTVTFLNGKTSLGTATLNATGVATLQLQPAVGSYAITASYSGSASDAASSSTPPIAVTVGQYPTTTTLTASASTLFVGQPLTLTATVKAASGATPMGTVTFLNGTASLGTATLNATGVATLQLQPAVGSYAITASYSGSASDAASSSTPPIAVTVGQFPTTTALTVSATTLTVGQTLTLTAKVRVTSNASSVLVPTGTVTFLNGTVVLGTAPLNPSGSATLTLTPAVGSYSITASYSGDVSDASSVSTPPVTVTVAAAKTTTTLIASANAFTYGQQLTLTATVKPASNVASGPVPVGTVQFWNRQTLLGSAVLGGNGVAAITITPVVGSYSIYAQYQGDSEDSASSSAPPIAVVVAVTPTKTALTSSQNPAPFGSSVTFTATVSDGDEAMTGTPAGSVTFYDGKASLGSAALQSAVATLAVRTLSPGSHSISSVYSGSATLGASTSNTIDEVIHSADFSLSAAPDSQTVFTGESAQYTVTVKPGEGFTLPVSLSCANLPANTVCNFSDSSINGGSGSAVATIQTSAPSQGNNASTIVTGNRVMALAGALLILLPRRVRKRLRGWKSMAWIALVSLATGAAILGCSGTSKLSGGTPVGAHTISIQGTSTNGRQILTHSATVTLNVKSLF